MCSFARYRAHGALVMVALLSVILATQSRDARGQALPTDASNELANNVTWTPAPEARLAMSSGRSLSTTAAAQSRPQLPNDKGQIWAEYDIRAYTVRASDQENPEQAVVNWILDETGWEVWHGDTFSILNADDNKLYVYHTREMQRTVAAIVRRFVQTDARDEGFGVRVVSVDHPSWRSRMHPLLHPVETQTPGVSAWIVRRENAAQIMAELQRRSDFQEHSAPFFVVPNGNPGVVSSYLQRTYTKDAQIGGNVFPGYQLMTGVFDSGFGLEFSPLLETDGKTVEAIIRMDIDQLENLVPVALDVSTNLSPGQSTRIHVPETNHFRMREKFRWPLDHVLLLDLGMIAIPTPTAAPQDPLTRLFTPNASRANVLVLIDHKGPVLASVPAAEPQTSPSDSGTVARPPVSTAVNPISRGRY